MSDDERDIDVDESDDDIDSDGRTQSRSANVSQYSSQAEKRAHHNALERKRRDHIKDSFTALRDAVPSLQGEKVASRAQILKKAAEYITFMKRKNQNHQQDNDDLKRQNSHLDQQIRQLERQLNASGDSDLVDLHGDQNSSESEMSMDDDESPVDIVTASSQSNSFRKTNGATSSSGNRKIKTENSYNSKVMYQ